MKLFCQPYPAALSCMALFPHGLRSIPIALLSFLILLLPHICNPAEQEPTSSKTAQELFQELSPLAENVPRTIRNPYWASPQWKLWAKDPSGLTGTTRTGTKILAPLPPDKRLIPYFANYLGAPMQLHRWVDRPDRPGGFWDDCYLSLDNNHSHRSFPQKQGIDAGAVRTETDSLLRLRLGVNFTTQSYQDRNRVIVDDTPNNLRTEKYFFFANTIRATPATYSLNDSAESSVTDLYDGLFAHSYQSLGKSGSETHAIYKMMIAGASIPRKIKNLLKKHGAYAIALLSIYKAALPYSDNFGTPLPYENELRHRPVYASNGSPPQPNFCAANLYYHGYNDSLHLWNMAKMARRMKVAPPVAILEIDSLAVSKDEKPVADKAEVLRHVKSYSQTSVRIWGEPGETITVFFNLKKSYDLQDQKLSYSCSRLYPGQRNIHLRALGNGRFMVRVPHEPNLPKGRIPLICTARNEGEVPSNPVFLNFYWPDKNEMANYRTTGLPKKLQEMIKASGVRRYPVTVNKRPRVSFRMVGDAVTCTPGEKVTIPFQANDPEGYPIRVYRWTDEAGELSENNLILQIPKNTKPSLGKIHLIFSDTTGGYSSKQIKLLVDKVPDTLPPGWGTTLLNSTNITGKITTTENNFVFSGRTPDHKAKNPTGLFAFKEVDSNDDLDFVAQFNSPPGNGDIVLMLSNTLDDSTRQIAAGYFRGKIFGLVRPREMRWRSSRTIFEPDNPTPSPKFFRLVSRNGKAAVFSSADNKHWRQLAEGSLSWFKKIYAGLLYSGSRHKLKAQWLRPVSPLPILLPIRPTRQKDGNYMGPLKITLDIPQSLTVKTILNGSTISRNSDTKPNNELVLNKPGSNTLRIEVYRKNILLGTVAKRYSLTDRQSK